MALTVINLERSQARLAAFAARNRHVREISRFAAIDGQTLDVPTLVRNGLIEPAIADLYSKGALGCAFSHLALWDQVIQSGAPRTICEDDGIANRHFDAGVAAVMALLPGDWDFVLWGWNADHSLLFDMLPGASPCLAICQNALLVDGAHRFQELALRPRPFPLMRAIGTVCYSISPAGARKLKPFCLPIRDMVVRFPLPAREGEPAEGFVSRNNGIDIMLNEAYARIKAFVSVPPLVITENDQGASTVRGKA